VLPLLQLLQRAAAIFVASLKSHHHASSSLNGLNPLQQLQQLQQHMPEMTPIIFFGDIVRFQNLMSGSGLNHLTSRPPSRPPSDHHVTSCHHQS
jgi:hypothetical protein